MARSGARTKRGDKCRLADAIEHWPVDRLIPYARNARTHSDEQVAQVAASIAEFGFVNPILVGSDGVMIAGHARLAAARKLGLAEVPVIVLDHLTPTQRRALVIADNKLALNAGWDEEMLRIELEALREEDFDASLTGFNQQELEKLLSEAEDSIDPDDEELDDPASRGIYALREDAIFSSSNKWGIPDLLPDMLSTQVPDRMWYGGPVEDASKTLFIYRTAKFGKDAAGGVLAFYVDDWRFENLWNDAVAVVEEFKEFGWGSILTPDFSVWRDDPMAVQLWNIYRSRWCGRYWQEAGIKVIPSLNWSDERSYEFAHAGIPCGVPVAGVQCRTTRSRKGKDYFIDGLCEAIRQVKPETLLIYGEPGAITWLASKIPSGPRCIWFESWPTARKRMRQQARKEEQHGTN